MARFEDSIAATPVSEAEIYRVLTAPEPANVATAPGRVRLEAEWEIDPRTKRPVCRWVMALRPSRAG